MAEKLTAKQQAFCESYVANGFNGLQAAISAGYSESSAKEMLRRVGLKERVDHRPSALSGGERQRVAVARALINNPLVVLADEPSGNLDLLNSKMLIDLLMEINRNSNKTFIIATHNPSIAERSHRVIYLK